jgi:pimeloyl-ACP methyl ester carboxylesterase
MAGMTKHVCASVIVCACAAMWTPAGMSVRAQTAAPSQADLEKLFRVLSFVRDRNARDYAIATPDGIDEGRYVAIGGIEQWITIRGEHRANPVVLFLHGGPGDATNPYGYAAFRPWLSSFTVVQWDQRGSGRTLGKTGPAIAETITIDRLAQDGIELADMLRRTLQKDKIVLVGHSWGSILGVFMARARPDLFSAFVGTGQVADSTKNYAVAYDALLAKARRAGEAVAISELERIGPPPYANGEGYQVQRKWSNFFEGADMFIASMFGLALDAPGYTVHDIGDWLDGQVLSADRLVPQTRTIDAKALGGTFALPVLVIQGAEDFTTPTSLARSFVDSIHAPRKAFVTIPDAGHFAVFMKREAFVRELVTLLAPPPSR